MTPQPLLDVLRGLPHVHLDCLRRLAELTPRNVAQVAVIVLWLVTTTGVREPFTSPCAVLSCSIRMEPGLDCRPGRRARGWV